MKKCAWSLHCRHVSLCFTINLHRSKQNSDNKFGSCYKVGVPIPHMNLPSSFSASQVICEDTADVKHSIYACRKTHFLILCWWWLKSMIDISCAQSHVKNDQTGYFGRPGSKSLYRCWLHSPNPGKRADNNLSSLIFHHILVCNHHDLKKNQVLTLNSYTLTCCCVQILRVDRDKFKSLMKNKHLELYQHQKLPIVWKSRQTWKFDFVEESRSPWKNC